ncbi:MAG TPA: hypothetical protein ACFYEK_10970 [Candidatus Wunengus sp. YC60]|uniref:hypothetical protein n=1 Tax=Candidatus Wunengus sp. YC60 TaxID=3367697 RepID=UPI0040255B32
MSDDDIVKTIVEYRNASNDFRKKRLARNSFNWDMYNLKMDFSHKSKGQSQEFIPKLSNGTEHLTSIIQNGITSNSDDWFVVEEGYNNDPVFDKDTIFKLMRYFLKPVKPHTFIANMGRNAGLDSKVAVKTSGRIKEYSKFNGYKGLSKEDVFSAIEEEEIKKIKLKRKINKETVKRWILEWELIDYVDFYDDFSPNPNGGLYRIHESSIDLYMLKTFPEIYPDIYDESVIKNIDEHFERRTEQYLKDKKSDTEDSSRRYGTRKKTTLTEFWGTILNSDGEAEDRLTNVVCCIANDKYLIRQPQKIEEINADNDDPFIVSTIIDLPGTSDGKGFLDAASALNKSYIEGFNLMLDGMMDAIKGVKQLRIDWLKKPSQIAKGIKSGTTLYINEDVPVGAYVLENCKTGQIPQDAFLFLKYLESLVGESMYLNEIRMGGMPAASTRATIAQMSEQNIQGVFSSFIRQFEDKCIVPLLEKTWLTILNNIDDANLTDHELISIIGEEKTAALQSMSKEERFLRGANSGTFTVRGISGYVQKMRDFQKYTNLLSVISQNPVLFQEFSRKYSIPKLIQQILMSTGLREEQLRLSEEEARIEDFRNRIANTIAGIKGSANQQPIMSPETVMTEQGPQGRMEGNVNDGQ